MKSLLVTLADKNYINHAKQLFSSVYHNAGWKGDYMLLAHEVPEEDLVWFREKGILVKKCEPLHIGGLSGTYPPVVLNKFYLFTPEFKQWDNVVFLDPDIIVRYSLDGLARVDGFHTNVDSTFLGVLKNQFDLNDVTDPVVRRFKDAFKLNAPALNTGVMAYSTDIIGENTFAEIVKCARTYEKICTYAEQSILSLFFYKKWKKLDILYNVYIPVVINRYCMLPRFVDGFVLHFCGQDKPWDPHSFFYLEWKANLDRADEINLDNGSIGQTESFGRIKRITQKFYYYISKTLFEAYYFVDRQIGRVGKMIR